MTEEQIREEIAEFLYWLANRGRSDIVWWEELDGEGREIWYGDAERLLRIKGIRSKNGE